VRDADEVGPAVALIGLEPGQKFTHGACCNPLPGERIVGIIFKGHGVVVHTIDCPNLLHYETQMDRWLDLHWRDGQHAATNPAQIITTILNGAGVMGRICTLIGDQNANISDIHFLDRKPDYFKLLVELELRDVSQLHMVLTALEAESDVAEVSRHRNPELGRDIDAMNGEWGEIGV
jgi:(p)ppGpp synthase/HD superfamily hydrolase